jgi:hypothetical protein
MTYINLIGVPNGVGIVAWTPAIAPAKNDGVWTSSPFVQGGQLVSKVQDDAIETLEITISGADKRQAGENLSRLLYNLDLAVKFWTGQAAKPDPYVYLETLLACGDYQYAIVKDYRFSLESDLLTTVGNGHSFAYQGSLVLRRGVWQETPPGEFVVQPFGIDENTVHISPAATLVTLKTGNQVDENFKPVANFWTAGDWTDIHTVIGGVVSANLRDSVPPFWLYTPGGAVFGDTCYFAITREGWGTSGGFDNYVPVPNSIVLVLDKALSTQNDLLNTMTLQYRDGGGVWQNLAYDRLYISDAAAGDDPRETLVIHWSRPAALGYGLPGVAGLPARTGFWFRLSAGGGESINVTQYPYSAQRNFIRFDAEDAPGDLDCPLRLQLFSTTDYQMKRILMGVYSQERVPLYRWSSSIKSVDYFTTWLPAIDDTHYYGNTALSGLDYNALWNVNPGGFGSLTSVQNFHRASDSNLTPVGGWTGAAVLNTALYPVYYLRQIFGGRFRIFMIAQQVNGNAGEIGWRLANFANALNTTPVWTSKTVTHKIVNAWEILEFGEISLPSSYPSLEDSDDLTGVEYDNPVTVSLDYFRPYLDFYGSAANISTGILGFFLLPIDENACEVYWPGVGPGASADGNIIRLYAGGIRAGSAVLTIDSAEKQKPTLSAVLHDDATSTGSTYPNKATSAIYHLTPISVDKLKIPAGKTSRLYFLSMKYDATTGAWVYDDEPLLFVKVFRSAQFQYARV